MVVIGVFVFGRTETGLTVTVMKMRKRMVVVVVQTGQT